MIIGGLSHLKKAGTNEWFNQLNPPKTEYRMFGKVKKWLGIEGVKVEIFAPETVKAKDGAIYGNLRFHSMNTQTVTSIQMKLIERYTRGRGADKLIDEYLLGEIHREEDFEVPEDEILEIEFELPFKMVQSDVEEFGSKNILFKGIANAAKIARAAKSEYRIEVEVKVKGVALNPIDKKSIIIKT